MESNTSTIT
ncbi:hypothetical protein YPPY14_0963, partial [Yersinia pestis PY-14]